MEVLQDSFRIFHLPFQWYDRANVECSRRAPSARISHGNGYDKGSREGTPTSSASRTAHERGREPGKCVEDPRTPSPLSRTASSATLTSLPTTSQRLSPCSSGIPSIHVSRGSQRLYRSEHRSIADAPSAPCRRTRLPLADRQTRQIGREAVTRRPCEKEYSEPASREPAPAIQSYSFLCVSICLFLCPLVVSLFFFFSN